MFPSLQVCVIVSVCLTCLLPQCVHCSGCKNPPPAKNFTNSRYYGLWYEIGKIQTAGGAFFEKDCVCTTIDVKPLSNSDVRGDASVLNSCRKKTPQGTFLNATGKLSDESPAGKWKEGFAWFAPKVDYTIIALDEDYAVEYDCGTTLGFTNYCIHILSRKPTQSPEVTQKLLTFAESLGLNTENLKYVQTLQTGCW
ncbi:apolipoprotein D-like [Lingula anatina]|uniref:Apolipoprotein D-like n=1 Tax=Lingula anatina TaxID=7574 RepID=A0A1S3K7B8_LINAN|nr:apolipoprotein D-like [Lingula anatina]|eukprot:XP_013418339.1 apolipoprotein D-like [Lingula anatina]